MYLDKFVICLHISDGLVLSPHLSIIGISNEQFERILDLCKVSGNWFGWNYLNRLKFHAIFIISLKLNYTYRMNKNVNNFEKHSKIRETEKSICSTHLRLLSKYNGWLIYKSMPIHLRFFSVSPIIVFYIYHIYTYLI
jgi:hypothetical protein